MTENYYSEQALKCDREAEDAIWPHFYGPFNALIIRKLRQKEVLLSGLLALFLVLLGRGVSEDIIVDSTGLSPEEIRALQD